jgi:CheY-like chemotaxis protein
MRLGSCGTCGLALPPGAVRCLRCGAQQSAIEGTLVDGRYRVESELGRGAMGVVYRARDVGLDRPVALKVIAPALVASVPILERFRKEAAALAAVRNDHVVQVFAFGRIDDSYFFAMEYIDGTALEDIVTSHVANQTFLSADVALAILGDAARGVAAIHGAGLLHRDLKPLNIVIEKRTGRAVVIDLGLSKEIASANLRQTELSGSPPYMSPEQILPSRYPSGLSPRTDVYALGCSAFEVLTGRLPFVPDGSAYATLEMHLNAPIPLVSSLRPELAAIDAVVARAMAKDPADRHASALELALDFERVARDRNGNARTMLAVQGAPSPRATAGARARIRVLVVDDDAHFGSVLARAARRAFPDAELDIALAESGVDALSRALEAPPDVITLDYDMPGMNGVETLSSLRRVAGAARTPAIVISGSPLENVRWRFEALGVSELLPKPSPLADVVGALRRSLGLPSIDAPASGPVSASE